MSEKENNFDVTEEKEIVDAESLTVDSEDRALDTVSEEEHAGDNALDKRLRKLNPKYKSKADLKAEREALSELEHEGYVPEKHESTYDVAVDVKVYSNNFVMSAVLLLFGFIVFQYTKAASALLWFYAWGVAMMAYKGIKTKIHVSGTNFTLKGTKFDGTYTFDQVEKIIYVYNKKDQRRYSIYVDGKKICEVPPGAIHSRWLYDDMMKYGVPGGWYNKL